MTVDLPFLPLTQPHRTSPRGTTDRKTHLRGGRAPWDGSGSRTGYRFRSVATPLRGRPVGSAAGPARRTPAPVGTAPGRRSFLRKRTWPALGAVTARPFSAPRGEPQVGGRGAAGGIRAGDRRKGALSGGTIPASVVWGSSSRRTCGFINTGTVWGRYGPDGAGKRPIAGGRWRRPSDIVCYRGVVRRAGEPGRQAGRAARALRTNRVQRARRWRPKEDPRPWSGVAVLVVFPWPIRRESSQGFGDGPGAVREDMPVTGGRSRCTSLVMDAGGVRPERARPARGFGGLGRPAIPASRGHAGTAHHAATFNRRFPGHDTRISHVDTAGTAAPVPGLVPDDAWGGWGGGRARPRLTPGRTDTPVGRGSCCVPGPGADRTTSSRRAAPRGRAGHTKGADHAARHRPRQTANHPSGTLRPSRGPNLRYLRGAARW